VEEITTVPEDSRKTAALYWQGIRAMLFDGFPAGFAGGFGDVVGGFRGDAVVGGAWFTFATTASN